MRLQGEKFKPKGQRSEKQDMRYMWYVLPVVVSGFFFFSKSSNPLHPDEIAHPVEPAALIVTSEVSPPPHAEKKVDASMNTAVAAQVKDLSRKAERFDRLPQPDQNWVLEKAANSYMSGQVGYGDLVQHISELASVRQHTVDERTQDYMPEPQYENQ